MSDLEETICATEDDNHGLCWESLICLQDKKIESQQNPETLKKSTDRLKNEIKKQFDSLNIDTSKSNSLYPEHLNQDRDIVDCFLVLDLFKRNYLHILCCGTSKILEYRINGGVL